jgi:hypothetical protein
VTVSDGEDAAIAWGEAQDGIAVGVGAVRTSVKSSIWPIIDAYLENRGKDALHPPIQNYLDIRLMIGFSTSDS